MSQHLELTEETTRRDAMARLATAFSAVGIDDPAIDARLLLCAAADIDHVSLIRDPDLPLEEAAFRLDEMAKRRLNREPVTRILGSRGFWSLELTVRPGVLDPRPDTETVIDAALDLFGQQQDRPLRMLDLGTGSGAIACALLDTFENATCLAVDVSPEACEAARHNLAHCGLAPRSLVRMGSWEVARPGPFDLIASNPPYIPSADLDGLEPEVRQHDPRLALDGGADGLDAYRAIIDLLPGLLAPDGVVIFEVGMGQAEAVATLLADANLGQPEIKCDLGGIKRVVFSRI